MKNNKLLKRLAAIGLLNAADYILTFYARELPLPYGRGFLLHSGPNGPAPQA